MMLKEFIYGLLNKRLDKKKHDYIKLQWQKVELEQKLANMKKEWK